MPEVEDARRSELRILPENLISTIVFDAGCWILYLIVLDFCCRCILLDTEMKEKREKRERLVFGLLWSLLSWYSGVLPEARLKKREKRHTSSEEYLFFFQSANISRED